MKRTVTLEKWMEGEAIVRKRRILSGKRGVRTVPNVRIATGKE
jgi:hypothetical protein